MSSSTPPERRTQVERRAATVRKLFDAACVELVEAGYAGATTARICARAGLSQGALFRHFPTREALMVALAEDIRERLVADFRAGADAIDPGQDRLVQLVRLTRVIRGGLPRRALHELVVASRTDTALRDALRPQLVEARRDFARVASVAAPTVAAALGPRLPLVVDLVLTFLDGEWLNAGVLGEPDPDDGRAELLAEIVTLLASRTP